MSEKEVIELMESSRNISEWNRNCDEVKSRCGGKYPDFWREKVITSGLLARKSREF